MRRVLLFLLGGWLTLVVYSMRPGTIYPEKLSDWQLFRGKISALQPVAGILPYTLNTPLFSDYAYKARFIRVPAGRKIQYTATGTLDFPESTLLIKNFYYPADFRKPDLQKRLIETRLLLREAKQWRAFTYVWNTDQTDADLAIAGDEVPVDFIDADGQQQHLDYLVPNLNQCKGCHNKQEVLMPIGPSASQLNGMYTYGHRKRNQLTYWKQIGWLEGLPAMKMVPKTAVWNDPRSGDLNARARAYLAINCAHCHRREGPAQTSGLFLGEDITDSTALGFNKTPVAAGRGSGGRLVDIKPGKATASIIWYRLHSVNPGERMPEQGRTMLHKEGLALITEWIDKMQPNKTSKR